MSEDGPEGTKISSRQGSVVSERERSEIMGMSTGCACVLYMCVYVPGRLLVGGCVQYAYSSMCENGKGREGREGRLNDD
jgi:hypothetical protein